jgi:hypothetical protein
MLLELTNNLALLPLIMLVLLVSKVRSAHCSLSKVCSAPCSLSKVRLLRCTRRAKLACCTPTCHVPCTCVSHALHLWFCLYRLWEMAQA